MRKTRNVTLTISEEGYREARIWAARKGVSLSATLAFLLECLPDVERIVRQLRDERPNLIEDLLRRRDGISENEPVGL